MKKNRKEKRKNRLFYLLILLLMTTMSLSISSYAWFTSNRLVRVDLLDVNVRAQSGIDISTDGLNWKSAISVIDIQNARTTYSNSLNQIPKYLEPVSTGGELDNGKLKMFFGRLNSGSNGNFVLSSERNIETESFDENSNGKFIAFDMFLKTNKDGQFYLTPDSNVLYGGENSFGIENAFRVAFIEEGTIATGSNIESIQSMTTNNQDNVFIWEPNYNTHTSAAIEHALSVYNINTSSNGERILYDGVIDNISEGIGITPNNAKNSLYPNYFKPVDIDYFTQNGFNENVEIFNLKKGITKYRVYMWIEGQDVDCENEASVGNITLDLQFSLNPS